MTLYIGLMSGTSMDGIDAALVDVSNHRLLYGIIKKYSDDVKKQMNKLFEGSDVSLMSICKLNTLIGKEFAHAAKDLLCIAKVSPNDIRAIGSHGQTLCHNAYCDTPYTLQLGCAHTISSLTGITVVADFRTRDLVNGGQGAPFAPIYHHQLFKNEQESVAIVNIGGITNITFMDPNEQVKGWDVGPGNCLMDAWIMKHQGKSYDLHGSWAKQGKIIAPLLEALISDSFICLPAPKSIGKEYYSLSWLRSHLKKDYQPVDVQKTLMALTARVIADSVLNEKNQVKKVYLCGGGAHNQVLLDMISQFLPQALVKSVAALGLNPDYLEAMMFAWLAAQTINQIPVDLSTITGAKYPAILGAIYPITRHSNSLNGLEST